MSNKLLKISSFFFVTALMLQACTIVKPGQTGVKRKLGKLSNESYEPGIRLYNPFLSRILMVPNRIEKQSAPDVIRNIGMDYEDVVILPVFRSAAADVTSKFYAKDMHSGERALIERNIRDTMMEILGAKGFIVENVLLKSISLPQGLSAAIEEKLRAEQEAQRMEFTKQKEKLEAERKAIQAEGDKQAAIIGAQGQAEVAKIRAEGQANAIKIEAEARAKGNEMLTKSLTNDILKNNQIEAFKSLSQSSNTKVIITDGKTPLLGIPEGGK